MKKYLFIVFIVVAAMNTSCVNDLQSLTDLQEAEIVSMEEVVNECEAELDSLDQIMPLSDTVGETDTYCDMRDAFNAFQYSKTIEGKREQFRIYVMLQQDVVEQAKEWMNNNAQDE